MTNQRTFKDLAEPIELFERILNEACVDWAVTRYIVYSEPDKKFIVVALSDKEPKGVFAISTSSQEEHATGAWWALSPAKVLGMRAMLKSVIADLMKGVARAPKF